MQRQKILIIEDDPAMVLYYTFALEAEYDILSATDGKKAIHHIKHLNDIDLVILDYRLHDISGIEVLRQIKRVKPSIPIILITAYGDEDVAVSSFRCGAKEYLKKPVTYDELFEKIRFCLSLKAVDKNNRINVFHDAAFRVGPGIPPTASTSHNFHKIQKAVQYIDGNYMTRITLGSVAGKACMSKHHFSRTFKKTMGVTFQQYLNDRRVDKAKVLLKNAPLTITEVAFSVGFTDTTHFARLFKRITGFTPSRYKNDFSKM